jgi:Flp pilus assembly pilin Flp
MIQFHAFQYRTAKTGVSMAEYAILAGLVGVAGIVALKTFGGSVHNLLGITGQGLETNNTLSVLKAIPAGNSGAVTLKGSGYYRIVTDPATGLPTLKLSAGVNGVPTNVTSVAGNFNTLGSLMLANKLDQLAQAETDPALKDYYARLAKLSYYLGGAEGELDDVPGLDLPVDQYTNGHALKDVVSYGQELQQLLNNPPANFQQSRAFKEVMPLAVDVYNIAQNYKNSLNRFIEPDGTILSFGAGPESTSGNGKAGSVLTNSALEAGSEVNNTHYDNLISYSQMKTRSKQVLSDNKVESVPVESTLTDATVVDATATQGTP